MNEVTRIKNYRQVLATIRRDNCPVYSIIWNPATHEVEAIGHMSATEYMSKVPSGWLYVGKISIKPVACRRRIMKLIEEYYNTEGWQWM